MVPWKRFWGARDSPRTTTSSSTCGTGSQRSPGNFTRQPFTALCRSGTSASTAKANTSDVQVLVSVPRPPVRFFFNISYRLWVYTDVIYSHTNTIFNIVQVQKKTVEALIPEPTLFEVEITIRKLSTILQGWSNSCRIQEDKNIFNESTTCVCNFKKSNVTLIVKGIHNCSYIYRVSQKHRQRVVCCAGRQTDHCPETQGLGVVERGSLRTNGCQNLFVLGPNTAGNL